MRNKLIIAGLFAMSVGLSSCFEDENHVYNGPLQVEFDPSPSINKSVTVPVGVTRRDSLKVQLIGPHQAAPIEGTSVLVTDKTTAQPGVEYTLIDQGRYIIPAGESFGYVRFFLTKPVDGTAKTLTFELQDTDKVKAAVNYKQSTVTIR